MILVFDATSLIYLAKVNLLRRLENLPEMKIIPKTVYKEVVERGMEKMEEDAFLVEKLVKKGVFKLESFPVNRNMEPYKRGLRIHNADLETLLIAKEKNGRAIVDDKLARILGKIENIRIGGSIYVLFRLLKNNLITKQELKNKFEEMISSRLAMFSGIIFDGAPRIR